jgi:protocatechuate 3,4-dioxygenase beta subunit
MNNTIHRRRALEKMGFAGLAALAGSACNDGAVTSPESATTASTVSTGPTASTASSPSAAACVLTPAETEGPYYFDAGQLRSNIAEVRAGTPLRLQLAVVSAGICGAIKDAVVDIWHCDASGLYSGYASQRTDGETFLRGLQVTDASGRAEFTTIYPGWYQGRTVHVHLKVHLDARTALTSQLYFPEAVTDEVYSRAPYAARGVRTTRNSSDSLYLADTLLDVASGVSGYDASIVIGVSS